MTSYPTPRRFALSDGTARRPVDDTLPTGMDPLPLGAQRVPAMRRLCLTGLFLALAGCQNSGGSLGYRQPNRVDDPLLSLEEQKSRGRLRYSYVEDDRLAPKTYVDRPDPTFSRN